MFKYLIAFYSLVITIVLFVGSIFFLPRPQAYATGVLFLPVVIFLWVRATNPEKVDSTKWSSRFVIAVFITGVLGVLAFWLAHLSMSKALLNKADALNSGQDTGLSASSSSQEILDKLDDISARLDKLETPQTNDKTTLGTNDSPDTSTSLLQEKTTSLGDPIGEVTIKDAKYATISIYESKAITSKVVGQVKYGETLTYYASEGEWYHVELPDGTAGWAQAQFLKEI